MLRSYIELVHIFLIDKLPFSQKDKLLGNNEFNHHEERWPKYECSGVYLVLDLKN